MSTYLLILSTFALAGATLGFALAVLFLKMRWNLVGGTLLLLFGWLPLGAVVVLGGAQVVDGNLMRLRWSTFGVIEMGWDLAEAVIGLGYLLGIVLGTVAGLWPRTGEDGMWQRQARSLSMWKILALPSVAWLLVAGLFLLADWRARQRLAQIRDQYQAQWQQSSVRPVEALNGAAPLHDRLLMALLEDRQPDWVEETNRPQPDADPTSPGFTSLSEVELLKIYRDNFPPTQTVRDFCQRHSGAYRQLQQAVLEEGKQFHQWHPQVIRYAMLQGLVHVLDDDLDAALKDLQLLRHMGQQSLDQDQVAFTAYWRTEFRRLLVFQAILMAAPETPNAIFDEMQAAPNNSREAMLRYLQRELEGSVIKSIDQWLAAPEEGASFEAYYQAAVVRIIQQHELPRELKQAEKGIAIWVANPSLPLFLGTLDDYFLATSAFNYDLYLSSDFAAKQITRRHLIRAARWAYDQHQQEHAWPSAQQFVQAGNQAVPPNVGLEYYTFHDPQSQEIRGAVVFDPGHRNLDDQLAIYLGEGVLETFPDPFTWVRSPTGNGQLTWDFTAAPGAWRGLQLPESLPTDASADDSNHRLPMQ